MTLSANPVAQWTNSSPSGSATTLVITVTATVPVGDHMLVLAGAGTTGLTATVTDSKGNTYATHKSFSRGTTPTQSLAMASSKITTQLVNGDTITITWSSSSGARTGVAARFSGGRQAGWFDAATAGGGASANTSSETVAGVTVAEAGELLVAAVIVEATGALTSVTGGWTDQVGVASGTTVRTLDWATKVRSAGAGTEPDLTIGHVSATSTTFMAAFRAEPPAKLLWEPPDFHIAYAGYVDVHIGDLTTWTTTALDLNTNYRIICDTPMNRDAVVIGGRNNVILGFESAISRAADPSATLAAGIAAAVDSTVITPITLNAPGLVGVAVNQAYVIDPQNATLSETVTVTSVTSATSFSVQRNFNSNGLQGDNGGGPGGPAHSINATIKKAKLTGEGYGIFLKDWSGTAHLEGAEFYGDGVEQCIVVHNELVGNVLQIENCLGSAHNLDWRNFHDAHPDGMQLSLGPADLRVDKLTLTTESNGLQWSYLNDAYSGTPWQGTPVWRVNRANIKGTATGRHMFYSQSYDVRILPNWQHGPSPIHNFTEVYLQPPAARVGSTIYADWVEGLNVNVPAMTELSPPATPPGGDFVLAADVGLAYVSPGYVEQVAGGLRNVLLMGVG